MFFAVYAIMIITTAIIIITIVIMIMQQLPVANEMNVKCSSFDNITIIIGNSTISKWILYDKS